MNFCTSCGKQLETGTQFCTSCGQHIETPSSSASSIPNSVQATARAAAPAQAPEYTTAPQWDDPVAKEVGGTPTALIAIGIVLVILIGIGVGVTLYMRNQVKNKASAVQTRVEQANGGSIGSDKSSSTDAYLRSLNLGAYPGSTPATISTDTTEDVISAFQTRDTPQQVIGYYKVRFPVADTIGAPGQSELRAALPSGHIIVRATQQGSGSLVYIIREP
jgi:hypothetical protein